MSIKYNVSGIKSIGRSAEQRLSNDYVVYGYPYYENGVCTEFATDSDHMYFVKKDKNTIYVDIRDINDIKAYIYDVPNDRFVTIKGAIFDQDVTLLQSDWNEDDETDIQHILNKPTTLSAFQNDVGYITNSTAEIGWTNLNQELQSIISGASELFFILDNASYLIVNQAVSLSNYPILRHNGKFYFYSHKGSNNEYYFYSIDGDGRCIDTFNTWSDVQLLSNVAYSGNYADLNNKPNLDVYAVKGSIVWNDLSQELKSYLDSNSLQYVTTNNSFSVINGYVQSDKYPILKHDGKLYFYSYKDSNDGIYFYNTHGEGKYVDITGTWHDTQLLSTVARTGNYSDLSGKPNLSIYAEKGNISYGDLSQQLKDLIDDADNVLANWLESDSTKDSFIKNKPDLDLYEEVISGNLVNKPVAIEYRFLLDSSSYIWKLYDGSTLLATFDMSNEDMQNSADTLKYVIENSDIYDTLVSDYHLAVSGPSTGIVAYSDALQLSLILWNDWYDENEYPELWLTENSIPRLESGYPKGYPNYGDKTFAQTGSSTYILPTNRKPDVVYIDKLTWSAWMWNPTTNSYEKLNPSDEHPTLNSTNSVSSGGVYLALIDILSTISTLNSYSNRVIGVEVYPNGSETKSILITDLATDTSIYSHGGCILIQIKGYVRDDGIRKPVDMIIALDGNGSTITSAMISRGGWMFPKTEFFIVRQGSHSVIGMRISQYQSTISYGYFTFDIIDNGQNHSWEFNANASIDNYSTGTLKETDLVTLDTIVKRAVCDLDGNVIKDTYVKLLDIEDTPYRVIKKEVTPIDQSLTALAMTN